MSESLTIRLLFALAGHSKNGLRLKQIAEGVQSSPSTTLRALQRLAEDGIAELVPQIEGHWRLSPRLVQIAIAHQDELAREERQLADFRNRYSRLPT